MSEWVSVGNDWCCQMMRNLMAIINNLRCMLACCRGSAGCVGRYVRSGKNSLPRKRNHFIDWLNEKLAAGRQANRIESPSSVHFSASSIRQIHREEFIRLPAVKQSINFFSLLISALMCAGQSDGRSIGVRPRSTNEINELKTILHRRSDWNYLPNSCPKRKIIRVSIFLAPRNHHSIY